MKNLNDYAQIYKEELAKGDIQKAYSGLVKYTTRLGTILSKNLSKQYSFSGLLQGYMDFTYIYYANDFLKKRKLKMALVLNHSSMQFEVWLLGQTIPVQKKYWQYFKDTEWNKGRTTMPQYSILETVIIDQPNFNDLDSLSKHIEEKLVLVSEKIQQDVETSSSKNKAS